MPFPSSWNISYVDHCNDFMGNNPWIFLSVSSSLHLCHIELHLHPTGYMEIKCMIVNNSQNKILKHFALFIPVKDQHKSFKRNSPYHVVFDFLQDVIIGHNQFFCCCAICYIGKDTQCLKERKTGKLFGPRSHPTTASLTALNLGKTIPLISFNIFNLEFPACSHLGPMPRSYQLWGAAPGQKHSSPF